MSSADDSWLEAAYEDLNGGYVVVEEEWFPEYEADEEEEYDRR